MTEFTKTDIHVFVNSELGSVCFPKCAYHICYMSSEY